jgi:hypothetical protein
MEWVFANYFLHDAARDAEMYRDLVDRIEFQ